MLIKKNDRLPAGAISEMETTLTAIERKIDKLDGIKDTIKNINLTLKVGMVVIGIYTAVSWLILGSYLGKILDALNALVLK
ncbi:MAG: hypothetical protein RSD49_15700 [Hafnia sp.]|uniref:hypothetical protein n=1 Tax=Hafnia sp. TaxID=1873498 RepID=UPI002FCB993B